MEDLVFICFWFVLDLAQVLPKSFEALNTTLYDMEDTTAVIRGHCSTYSFNPSSFRQLDEIMVSAFSDLRLKSLCVDLSEMSESE